MSLILDALRKLEREKGAHEPGVLVVGSVPWGERSRTRRLLLGAGAVLALALAVLAGWLMRSTPTLPDAAHPAAASPTPPEAASVAPTPLPATPSPPALAREEEAAPAPPIRLSHPPVLERPPTPPARAAAAEEQKPEVAAPAAAPSPTVPDDLRLSAISRRDGKPVALINDRLVFEGDSFDGVRVIRIGEAEVEVEVKGQRRVLRF
jgi:type IV secretory pathway VirB10-like protein